MTPADWGRMVTMLWGGLAVFGVGAAVLMLPAEWLGERYGGVVVALWLFVAMPVVLASVAVVFGKLVNWVER